MNSFPSWAASLLPPMVNKLNAPWKQQIIQVEKKGFFSSKWHYIICKSSPFCRKGGLFFLLFSNPNLVISWEAIGEWVCLLPSHMGGESIIYTSCIPPPEVYTDLYITCLLGLNHHRANPFRWEKNSYFENSIYILLDFFIVHRMNSIWSLLQRVRIRFELNLHFSQGSYNSLSSEGKDLRPFNLWQILRK